MEGYVQLKYGFTAINLKVWMVLDGQHMTYYDALDLTEQQPVRLRGTLEIKEAEIKKFKDKIFPFGLKVKNKTGGKVVFNCETAALWNSWFNALTRAVKEHTVVEERRLLPFKYREILEIDKSITKLSKGLITRAYKKLSLKEHPDKGGDADKFNRIREAYNGLLAIQAEFDEREACDIIHYEAIVEKSPGVGIGIGVTEDATRQQFLVANVIAGMKLHGLSSEADGEIRPGDAIVGIDHDEISSWYMSRLKARLDEPRLKMGDKVLLVFERRVPHADNQEEDNNVNNLSYTSSPVRSPMPEDCRSDSTKVREEAEAKAEEKRAASEPVVIINLPPPPSDADSTHHDDHSMIKREEKQGSEVEAELTVLPASATDMNDIDDDNNYKDNNPIGNLADIDDDDNINAIAFDDGNNNTTDMNDIDEGDQDDQDEEEDDDGDYYSDSAGLTPSNTSHPRSRSNSHGGHLPAEHFTFVMNEQHQAQQQEQQREQQKQLDLERERIKQREAELAQLEEALQRRIEVENANKVAREDVLAVLHELEQSRLSNNNLRMLVDDLQTRVTSIEYELRVSIQQKSELEVTVQALQGESEELHTENASLRAMVLHDKFPKTPEKSKELILLLQRQLDESRLLNKRKDQQIASLQKQCLTQKGYQDGMSVVYEGREQRLKKLQEAMLRVLGQNAQEDEDE